MRVLVISKPATPPPMELTLSLMHGFKAWREKRRPKMEAFEFFVAGGGWGVVNADEKELSQMMMEYPWQPFSTTEVMPTVDGDEALDRAIETLTQMMAAMRQA